MTTASAAGKIIVLGEHAVVYGRPALAVPISELRARVRVESRIRQGVVIHARNVNRTFDLATALSDDPLAAITRATLDHLGVDRNVGIDVWIDSDIPLASGLGSGAAVSTAIARALALHFRMQLQTEQLSALVFETEKLYHGTPSGIDNSVIALERPIRFSILGGAQPIRIARPLVLVVANTGVASPTRIAVGDVRRTWQEDRSRLEVIFDGVGDIVKRAQLALAVGLTDELGELMTQNQALLRLLGVSSSEIDNLIQAGMNAGALGGKLSGAGRGGNVIFQIHLGGKERIEHALLDAGATSVLTTTIQAG